MGQGDVLRLLEKHPEGLTVVQMSKKCKIGRSSLNSSVNRLRNQGMIIVADCFRTKGSRVYNNLYKINY